MLIIGIRFLNYLEDDNIDYKLVNEVVKSQSQKFDIVSVQNFQMPMSKVVDGKTIKGHRDIIEIVIDGFTLTYAALDEFLSSSSDEYLSASDLSDINPSSFSKRPYYQY